ncbi:hypothetical protein JCM9140_1619 [Halalkalibacter wakoensis JCM 9140]|uniref:IDEAL domain-containing protein n=2 Tax=Halalkalibacter wakoensis TaxID=127891 RepID=W4Q1L1_9BACI|nr:hypothetical protein JCM9140_1619 [Halalkalibacter wakoensis JCM 9140]
MFSDNSGFVGRTIRIEKRDMEKQEMLTSYSEGELLNLIDLALSTRDKDWFIELSEKLKRKQNIISFIKRGI